MRLLNLDTLELETFYDDSRIPPYAILSHTWGTDEVKLQDLELPQTKLETLLGWNKIINFCSTAKERTDLFPQEIRYGWVDTCCIDKSSSAELSEAINSMFAWYRGASACFVFLDDLDRKELEGSDAFEKCRWFTRGWTLQELLAPRLLYFFDKNWEYISDKDALADRICARTRIDVDVILTGSWEDTSIAQRISWVSTRTTTRVEDMAYCLLGVFDVNMPTIYGEGEKAFIRLQEEIMKESTDQSIFAWDASKKDKSVIGALATSPSQFYSCHQIEILPTNSSPATITSRGVQANFPIVSQELPGGGNCKVALLWCRYSYDLSSRVGIPVSVRAGTPGRYARTKSAPLSIPMKTSAMQGRMPPPIYLEKRDQDVSTSRKRGTCWVQFNFTDEGFEPMREGLSQEWYISPARSMTMRLRRQGASGSEKSSIVLPFKHIRHPDVLYVVLRLDNSTGVAAVGLRVMKEDAVSVKTHVERFLNMASSIAIDAQEQVHYEPLRSVFVSVGIMDEDPSVFKVTVSQTSSSYSRN